MITRNLWLATAVVLATVAVAVADFQAGMQAYRRGAYIDALREWRPLAERGDVPAQTALGVMYREGLGVQLDENEALAWFRRSARQGHALAQFELGAIYQTESIRWQCRAASQGNAEAQAAIENEWGGVERCIYLESDFTGQGGDDPDGETGWRYLAYWIEWSAKSTEWYCQAALQGNADAQAEIGFQYVRLGYTGDSVAHYWLSEALRSYTFRAMRIFPRTVPGKMNYMDPEDWPTEPYASVERMVEELQPSAAQVVAIRLRLGEIRSRNPDIPVGVLSDPCDNQRESGHAE